VALPKLTDEQIALVIQQVADYIGGSSKSTDLQLCR
jgi:hypothetical protein